MQNTAIYRWIAWAIVAIATASPGFAQRVVTPLNRDWSFTLGDPQGAERATPQGSWQPANLPHSFATPYFLGTGFYVGYGWYRKTIDLPESSPRTVSLEFDGVFQHAEIFVNGRKAGEHKGGYTGFTIDITRFARRGANLIAVRVDNLWNAKLAPRAGEHVFAGGIYRDVRLVVTDPVHVAWYGTHVTTPHVSSTDATVNATTEVRNDGVPSRSVTLVSRIFDPNGAPAGVIQSTAVVPGGSTYAFDQTPPPIRTPRLWGPGHPALYTLRSEVRIGSTVVDRFETRFGIRTISWTRDKGFFLNGASLYLVGANVHQDQAGWGDAVSHSAMRRDVAMIKDAGFNFIRGSHYPHSPAFSQATDEQGMLLWSETPFWGIGGYGADGNWNSSAYPPHAEDQAAFEQSVLDQLGEMIRIHRNHPSIVAWSTGNETFFSDASVTDKMRALLRREVALMHTLDPSRPAAVGGAQRGEIDRIGDVAGYNGDGAAMFIKPDVANNVSEYGSTTAQRPGDYAPGWGNLVDGPDQKGKLTPYPWRYPWRSGEVIWAGFDHGSIAAVEFGEMGMIDYFRLPKRQYFWYRNAYTGVAPPPWPKTGKPAALTLTADKRIITGTQGFDDVQLVATVVDAESTPLSNSPDVTLTILSGPGEFPTGRRITFANTSEIAIRDGKAAIALHSHAAGRTIVRATSAGLAPATIVIETTGAERYREGVTPLAADRTVRHYPPIISRTPVGEQVEESGQGKDVALDRPTGTSGSAAGHTGNFANDADRQTWWQADRSGPGSYLYVDLENIYRVTGVSFEPVTPGDIGFVIESSPDRANWTIVATLHGREPVWNVNDFATQVTSRFIRIRYTAIDGAAAIRALKIRATAR